MLAKIKQCIVQYIKKHFIAPLLPTPINNKRDFIFRIMFLCFAALCVLGGLVVGIVIPKDEPLLFLPCFLIGCSLPFVPKIISKTFHIGKASYSVGKTATTTEYVEIQQVSDTQYRATHHKEHQGDIFAIAIGTFTFIFTWFFYMIFGPFMLGYKIYKIASQLYEYKRDMSECVSADEN